jgi:hypothetical protein
MSKTETAQCHGVWDAVHICIQSLSAMIQTQEMVHRMEIGIPVPFTSLDTGLCHVLRFDNFSLKSLLDELSLLSEYWPPPLLDGLFIVLHDLVAFSLVSFYKGVMALR